MLGWRGVRGRLGTPGPGASATSGALDSRTTSRGATRSVRKGMPGAAIRSRSSRAAIRPRSRAPSDTELSDGLKTRANWVSSMPTTASCRGTRRPALAAPRITPKASRSLAAMTASGRPRGLIDSTWDQAASPAVTVNPSAWMIRPASPAAAQASWKPSSRACPGAVSGGPLTKAMRRRPLSSRCLCARTTPARESVRTTSRGTSSPSCPMTTTGTGRATSAATSSGERRNGLMIRASA